VGSSNRSHAELRDPLVGGGPRTGRGPGVGSDRIVDSTSRLVMIPDAHVRSRSGITRVSRAVTRCRALGRRAVAATSYLARFASFVTRTA